MARQTSKHKKVIIGISLITLSVLLVFSIFSYNTTDYADPEGFDDNVQNVMGKGGAYVSHYLITNTFGYAVAIPCVLLFIIGLQFIRQKAYSWFRRIAIYSIATMVLISYGLAIVNEFSIGGNQSGFELSGLIGGFFASYSAEILGKAGTIIIFIALTAILLILWSQLKFWVIMEWFEKYIKQFVKGSKKLFKKVKDAGNTYRKDQKKQKREREKEERLQRSSHIKRPERTRELPGEEPEEKSVIEEEPETAPSAASENPLEKYYEEETNGSFDEETKLTINKPKSIEVVDDTGELQEYEPGIYKLPSLNLLEDPPSVVTQDTEDQIMRQAEILETTLMDFGVHAKVVEVHPGPVLTLYEVRPATGVKVSRILGLQDDIALAMKARGIRLIAPIPGKDTVGVELPNMNPQTIFLKSLLTDPDYNEKKSTLSIPLGRTTTGEVYSADLAKMPHLLVAGQTGAGKSVGINTIIASILYNASPKEVQFVLIDPKMVELSSFKKLHMHHLLKADFIDEKVITKPQNAVLVLKSIVNEMEKRYEIMAKFGVRNIADYNAKEDKEADPESEETYPDKFEYIVVIVDELADLMMVASKEVEEPIARLAQMARAVGIHLILATQRPSVDVLTGFIKSNFPARIAYRVFSKTDSRTILDMNGADTLLGQGDMLYLPPGSPQPVRIQNAFISSKEIDNIINHVAEQAKFEKSTKLVLENQGPSYGGGGFSSDGGGGGRDSLFTEAARIVVTHQQGSISLLQRRLKIGYSRAARLIDEMEEAGIVGPYDGSKARQVIVEEEDLGDIL